MVEWFQVLVGLTALASLGVYPAAIVILLLAPAGLPKGICHSCGYSLVGLPASGTCPECGLGYLETPTPTESLQTPAELRTLRIITVVVALAVQLTALASMNVGASVATILFLLLAAAVVSGPPIVLSFCVPARMTRAAVWMVSIIGVLPGAALGAWIVCDAAQYQHSKHAVTACFVVVCGAGLSGTFGGLAAIAAVAIDWERVRELRRHRRRVLANERARLRTSRHK
ncbi:MAG: hypothetical protein KF699_05020 [Phycisphaeraceae bacterium]|nr:hypothetical protein [Phycisphaeraceae bacterium]